MKTNVVDLDAPPFCPSCFQVVEHRKGGLLDLATAKIDLYLAEAQKEGVGIRFGIDELRKKGLSIKDIADLYGVNVKRMCYIDGSDLRKELEGKPVLNANVLDFYLANPHRIPEEWRGKDRSINFWGTVYRDKHYEYVRALWWRGGEWHDGLSRLFDMFTVNSPAAILVSNA